MKFSENVITFFLFFFLWYGMFISKSPRQNGTGLRSRFLISGSQSQVEFLSFIYICLTLSISLSLATRTFFHNEKQFRATRSTILARSGPLATEFSMCCCVSFTQEIFSTRWYRGQMKI